MQEYKRLNTELRVAKHVTEEELHNSFPMVRKKEQQVRYDDDDGNNTTSRPPSQMTTPPPPPPPSPLQTPFLYEMDMLLAAIDIVERNQRSEEIRRRKDLKQTICDMNLKDPCRRL